jgi:hypothetical protein
LFSFSITTAAYVSASHACWHSFATAQQHLQPCGCPLCWDSADLFFHCSLLQPVQQQLRLKTSNGRSPFAGKYKLQFWVYVGVTGWEGTSAKVPDININIGGDKVGPAAVLPVICLQQQPKPSCRLVRLLSVMTCSQCIMDVPALIPGICCVRRTPCSVHTHLTTPLLPTLFPCCCDRVAVRCGASTTSSRTPSSHCASTVPTTTGAGSEWLHV